LDFDFTQDQQSIAWAQGCLSQITGNMIPQDGRMGPATRRAIQTFQTQIQLLPSGALDDNTLAALQQACQADAGADDAGGPFSQSEADFLHEFGTAGSKRDQAVVTGQIARGIKDENKVTDAVFYDRHPEWKGKSLKNASRTLRQEWVQIRDTIVRPLHKRPPTPVPPPTPLSPPTPVPPAGPVPPAKPAPLPSSQPGAGVLGYNIFDSIRRYRPALYRAALAAQTAFQKVRGFLPWYQKIMNAVPGVEISLDSHGIGDLVFSMDKRSFTELVHDKHLLDKALETAGSGLLGRLEFSVDFIGLLGLGQTLLEIARGIENERMLGGVGPASDKWRRDQALKFVIGLMAEDLSRLDLSGSYFVNRNARDLAAEITGELAEFQPINNTFVSFLLLEDQLARIARDQGNVPDVLPPVPATMSSREL